MQTLNRDWGSLHFRVDGPQDGLPLLAINSLGTDLRMWDAVVDALPSVRFIRFDMRGHGLSDAPDGGYSIAALAGDAAALLESLELAGVVVMGCSIGGMVAQQLAAERPELCSSLILSNTAVKIGDATVWAERIDQIERQGLAAMASSVMERWFSPRFRAAGHERLWSNMMARQSVTGYCGCCQALADADLAAGTSRIDKPVLMVAGEHDGSTPPDMVAATAALIAGSRLVVLADAGHIPAIEAPESFALLIKDFLQENPNV